jgi:hypothetical protein
MTSRPGCCRTSTFSATYSEWTLSWRWPSTPLEGSPLTSLTSLADDAPELWRDHQLAFERVWNTARPIQTRT